MKPNTKILLSLAAVTVLSIIFLGWIVYTQGMSTIRRIRNSGDPVSLLDLKPKPVSPDENAATYLNLIADDARNIYNKIHLFAHADDFSWRIGLNDTQIKKIEEAFAADPRVNELLDLASQCTELVRQFDYTLTPTQFNESLLQQVEASRDFARVGDCYARYLASTGRSDEAAKIYLRHLRLTRLQERDPMILSLLVNTACLGIAEHGLNGLLHTSTLTPETHRAIEEELEKHKPLDSLVGVLKTERAFGIDSLRGIYGSYMFWGPTSYLDSLEQQIQMGGKPHFETLKIETKIEGGLADLVQPALNASRETANRSEANTRCLRILNAIIARGIRSEPIDIDSLGLPKQIFVDPYIGNSLLIKLLPSGWTVYSVGQDGNDNGGQLRGRTDIGFGPPEEMK